MVSSEQRKNIGNEFFVQLQNEVSEAKKEKLDDFLSNIKPNDMGFDGKEGLDED